MATASLPEPWCHIDFKPGNETNHINPKSRGKITVVILTTADFDANTVDVESLRFGATGSEALPERSAFDDVDGNGDLDLCQAAPRSTPVAIVNRVRASFVP